MSNASETIQKRSSYRLPTHRGERIRLAPHQMSPDPKDKDAVRRWLEERPRPWAIDLFCGAGGLSLGLEEEGFSVVAAADADQVATETHAANIHGLTWTGDLSDPSEFIRQLDDWGIEEVDLLAGGPPCQPFSTAGMSKIGDLVRRGDRSPRDERADLWRSFFAIVDRLNPRAMLFENVPNFAQAQGGALLIALLDELKGRGYGAHVEVLEAWRYRVPQHRSRLFVIGIAEEGNFEWPKPIKGRPTVGQVIGDLPVVEAGVRDEVQGYKGPPESVLGRLLRKGLTHPESQLIRDHVTRSVRPDDAEIYKLLKPGGTYMDVPEHLRRYRSDTFSDKYLRLSFEDLSRTITAHIAKDGYWYIHPREDRTLSIREAARIQTFPDRFRFAGQPSNRYRQIGNAVPPLLASAIASAVKDALEDRIPVAGTTGRQPKSVGHLRDNLSRWFGQSKRDFPWRRLRLSPWQILLLEMCLHRTKAEQVARVADKLLSLGETPDSFLSNSRDLAPVLSSLGLHWRSVNLASAAEFVRDRLAGEVPDNWQELTAIPGVGDYIASAVLCFAFGRPSVLMDTNTVRIARRLLGSSDQPNWQLRLALHKLAGPRGADVEWNQALLDLGALVCTARAPKCGECPIRAYCKTGTEMS
ncbi:MAG: DNA (cytosine-5-)-methyltransferase [Chloroflexi bacterium]|nr:DNA (cytosine-5-)-methyltransferase [Chloroflexota bacterium]